MTTVQLTAEAFRKELRVLILEMIAFRSRGKEMSISADDLKKGLSIKVEVDNSYLEVGERTYENRVVDEISVGPDGTIILHDEYGEQHLDSQLSLDELVEIALVIEESPRP